MEILLIITAIALLIVGILGAVVPVMPGPPLSWFGLFLLKFTSWGAAITWEWVIVFAIIMIIVSIIDYIVPIWGAKKFGGTKAGIWGAAIGVIAGILLMPLTIFSVILGPFIGAVFGEIIFGATTRQSLKAAVGTFIGFMFGMGLKLTVSFWIAIYCAVKIIVAL